MPMIDRRRSSRSSSSSRSRSLSPYNKRRRAKIPEQRRNMSRRSSPPRKRSYSPRRRSPPRRSPPGRRRSSPARYKRRSPPSPRRRPSPRKPSPKRRSRSPRRDQRSKSRHKSPRHRSPVRRKSPSPSRKRSPPHSNDRNDKRSPSRRQQSSHGDRRRSPASNHSAPSSTKRHRSPSPRVPPPPPPIPPNDPRYEHPSGERHSGDNSSTIAPSIDPLAGTHDVDYRKGAGRGAKEPEKHTSSSSSTQQPPKRVLGYTGVTTHQRFTPLSTSKDFKPKDIISIGIERNIVGDEPAVIPKVLRAEDVVIKRRKDEGEQILHLREEFETRDDDVEEKRTIKVVRSSKSPEPNKKKKKFEHENFEVRPEMLTLSDRWSEKSKKTEQAEQRQSAGLKHGDRDERLVTPRSSDKSSDRRKERAKSPVMKLTISDRDERIVSTRDSGSRVSRRDGKKDSSDKANERDLPRDPNDLRYNLSRKRGERPVMDAREKIRGRRVEGEKRRSESPVDFRKVRRASGDVLPDFSKRPDKFTYKEWEDNPELIPKGNMYYEVSNPILGNHDNSSSDDEFSSDSDRHSHGRASPERHRAPQNDHMLIARRSNTQGIRSNGNERHSNRGGKRSPRNGAGRNDILSLSPDSLSPTSPPKGVRSKLVKPEPPKAKQKLGGRVKSRQHSLEKSHNVTRPKSTSPKRYVQRTPERSKLVQSRSTNPQRTKAVRPRSRTPQRSRPARSKSHTPQRSRPARSRSYTPQKFRPARYKSPTPQRSRPARSRSRTPQRSRPVPSRSPTPQRSRQVRSRSRTPQRSRLMRSRSRSQERLKVARSRSRSPEKGKLFRKPKSSSASNLTVKTKHSSRYPVKKEIRNNRSRSPSWSRYDQSSRSRNDERPPESGGLYVSRNDLESSLSDLGSKDIDERVRSRPYSPIVWTGEHPDLGSRDRPWDHKDKDYRMLNEQTKSGAQLQPSAAQYYREDRRYKRDRAQSPPKHDNREDFDYWSRMRGRGRGRGRGAFRGRPIRGRSYGEQREQPWLHDKYQDQEPSSTTK